MKDFRDPQTPQEAADWFARLHSGQCTPQQEEAFLSWVMDNPQHAAQYQKCLHSWDLLGHVPQNAFLREAPPLWQRRAFLAAASALVCVGGGVLFSRKAQAKTYRTMIGEQRRISLADGSDVVLDTNSELKFTSGMTMRCAEILCGRVYISTAPEGHMPLLVKCGKWKISTKNGDMDLYKGAEFFSAWFRNGHGVASSLDGIRQKLTAGERMRASATRVLLDHPDPAVMKAWKAGQLVFQNTSLARAAQEMNRYSKTQLLIDDPAAAALHISGVYRAGKCQRFAHTIAMVLPVKIYRNASGIHIATPGKD